MALRARCITSATQVWRYCVVGCSAACGMATSGFHSYQSDCLCEPLIEITIATTKPDKIKNLHSANSIDTENSGTRGRPIWVHSSQVGKADSKWVCHVVPAYPNVSPGPMNGSILLRWACFDRRQNHLRDTDGTLSLRGVFEVPSPLAGEG